MPGHLTRPGKAGRLLQEAAFLGCGVIGRFHVFQRLIRVFLAGDEIGQALSSLGASAKQMSELFEAVTQGVAAVSHASREVAIGNAGRDSIDEDTPTRDNGHDAGGLADRYGQMLVYELKPWVDHNWRTRRGARDTGLAGSSLGGLLTLHLGLTHSAVFGKILVLCVIILFLQWRPSGLFAARSRSLD